MTEEIQKASEPSEEVPTAEIPVAEPEEVSVSDSETAEAAEESETAAEASAEESVVEENPAEDSSEAEPVEEPAADPEAENPAEKPQKKKRGYVRYSPLSLLLLAVCAFVFSFSMFGLLEQNLLDAAGSSQKDDLSQIAFPDGSGGGEDGSLIPGATPDVNKWQEISPWSINPHSLPFLRTVNFGSLKTENPDTVAWMYMPSTADVKGFPINLPVVQSSDNEYYLTRSFDGTPSDNGWVYADFRNNLADLRANRNLIIYGHARSYLIFGGLKYLDRQTRWQQDGYNQFLYVNTPTERTVWQIFSWYETTVDFNYISTSFDSDSEYVDFLRTLQEKNQLPVFKEFNFTASDRILTLSTCKGSDENVRVAVHAVLVRHEALNVENPPATDGLPNEPTTDAPSTDLPSDPNDVPDSGTVTDTGTQVPPTVTDVPATETGIPPVTVTDTPPVSSDVPPDSGGVSTPASGSSAPSVTDRPGDESSDGGTPPDTASSETSGTASDAPDGGVTDGGTPSDTGAAAETETSDLPQGDEASNG
ncbi:MAG: sortase [Clostridia bacterium]|nr:sortase [Clostridia bacterium]